MVSDKLMKEFLGQLSPEAQPLRTIARKLNRDDRNTRVVLQAMAELGICELVDLPEDSEFRKNGSHRLPTKGWKLRGGIDTP